VNRYRVYLRGGAHEYHANAASFATAISRALRSLKRAGDFKESARSITVTVEYLGRIGQDGQIVSRSRDS